PTIITLEKTIADTFNDTDINDPFGFGNGNNPITTGGITLSKAVPNNGVLSQDVNFTISDGPHSAKGVVHLADTQTFTSIAQLVALTQTAIDAALALLPGNTVTV